MENTRKYASNIQFVVQRKKAPSLFRTVEHPRLRAIKTENHTPLPETIKVHFYLGRLACAKMNC